MSAPLVLGRYRVHDEIASGGMATVHIARQMGDGGFARTVAIKRLHGHLARDPEFVAMLLDEARLAARIRHPNVVPTLDVVSLDKELFLVMEYVSGQSLSKLLDAHRSVTPLPIEIVAAIIIGTLDGLHAAHGATNEAGELLHLVHRDVSPQNVLVGADGVARLVDFGIAKAVGRSHTTRDGRLKGKTSYMAPEQLSGRRVDARTDVYAASVVLWEALTGTRLFRGETPEESVIKVLELTVPSPSTMNPNVTPALDACVLRGLSRRPEDRFATAREMALALEAAVAAATPRLVGEWVESLAGAMLRERAAAILTMERIEPQPVTVAGPALDDKALDEATTPARPPRRSRAMLAAAFALVTVGVASASLRAWSSGSVATAGSSPALSTSAPPPTASSLQPAALLPAVASSPEPPAFSSDNARRPIKKVAVPPASKKRCEPPYTIDKNGDRVPKPECL